LFLPAFEYQRMISSLSIDRRENDVYCKIDRESIVLSYKHKLKTNNPFSKTTKEKNPFYLIPMRGGGTQTIKVGRGMTRYDALPNTELHYNRIITSIEEKEIKDPFNTIPNPNDQFIPGNRWEYTINF